MIHLFRGGVAMFADLDLDTRFPLIPWLVILSAAILVGARC